MHVVSKHFTEKKKLNSVQSCNYIPNHIHSKTMKSRSLYYSNYKVKYIYSNFTQQQKDKKRQDEGG